LAELERLHRDARAIFDSALLAVDPREAVVDFCREYLKNTSTSSPIYSIAIGKAATSMAIGLEEGLGERFTAGVISSPDPPLHLKRWSSFLGGHPLPNQASIEAAHAAFTLLDRASAQRALVVFLISGGGSAMLEWPITRKTISLEDLRDANQTLITCGARISEVNAVRRAFSAVKGGALARRAPYAQMITLIVSDTNRGDEASVASGPTLSPPMNAPAAIEVIERYGLELVLPASIVKSVQQASAAVTHTPGSHHVLLGNWDAVEAAAHRAIELGFTCVTREDICEQPIDEGCDLLLSGVDILEGESNLCEISGGEFSCPVRGDGRGGRNLETVLRCATKLDSNRPHTVILSAGTDGVDGNSPCAGAIADETTIARARRYGLDPEDFLARSDSYGFFDQLDALVLTGPTGTNVRDLRIVLKSVRACA